ncbi:MAG: type II toxin-antitoxin system VapC family toxin [Bacteroidota bacterium]
MGQRFLLDTNVLIQYLNNSLPPYAINAIQSLISKNLGNVCPIIEIELLAGTKSANDYASCLALLKLCSSLPIDDKTKEAAIKIRNEHRLKLPDCIIAATAQAHNLILLSANKKDFSKIDNLQWLNPLEDELSI